MNFASVKFGQYDSWEDWKMLLIDDDIGFPEHKALIDELKVYGVLDDQYDIERDRRELEFTFQIRDATAWPELVTRVTAAIHGKKLPIVRSCEPEFTYIGRCRVDEYKTSKAMGTLVIQVDAEPFKYKDYVTETMNETAGKTITVDTEYLTPTIVTVKPMHTAIVSITLQGLARNPITGQDENITVRDLAAQEEVEINGELGTVTVRDENKYPDADLWEFPNLKAGNQIIGASNTTCNITIKYRPRYI